VEPNETNVDDLTVFNEIVSALKRLDADRRENMLDSVMTFLRMGKRSSRKVEPSYTSGESGTVHGGYSEDRSISPKDFMLEKQPRTDVERVACLAYYLTHYRGTPHFKTIDLSTLNTEAAQVKFSNAAFSVNNATKLGYLVPATKGQKQLSAIGEKFVRALPDRDAAREVMSFARPRRKNRKMSSRQGKEQI
ncbi:MAG: hypothetical protein ACRD5H_04285, partial [Nitrososphaerales archaeon]